MRVKSKLSNLANSNWTGKQIYLVMFALYLLLSYLETTSFMQYFSYSTLNYLMYIVAAIVVGKMYLMDGLQLPQILIRTVLLGFAFISWRHSNANQVILMMIFILGATNVSFRNIMKWFYWLEVIVTISIIVFAISGIIQDYIYHPVGRPMRMSLGINYPTDLSAHVLFLLLSHCYLHFNQLNLKYYVSYLLIAILMLIITNGRLSFICECLMILSCFLAKLAERGLLAAKLLTVCYWAASPILAVIIALLSYLFQPNIHIFAVINKALSGRLALGHQALDKGITMFGQQIHENGLGGSKGMAIFLGHSHQQYFYIDSSYLRLFIIYGFVVGLIFMLMLMFIGLRATSNLDYPMMVAILVIGVSCCVEQHLLDVSFNPFLLSLVAIPDTYLEDKHESI